MLLLVLQDNLMASNGISCTNSKGKFDVPTFVCNAHRSSLFSAKDMKLNATSPFLDSLFSRTSSKHALFLL